MATVAANPSSVEDTAAKAAALDTSHTAFATVSSQAAASGEDATVRAMRNRHERLMMVRRKAIEGKGAWYWCHLEPILASSPNTGVPKAVKLRCLCCNSTFSASNPSRTASEHLKRGTCPNFNSSPVGSSSSSPSLPKPIAFLPPSSSSGHKNHHDHHHNRKRGPPASTSPSYQISPLAIVEASAQQQLMLLSDGKEELRTPAIMEGSLKKPKSPKAPPVPSLTKEQVDSAFSLLADWVYESGGSVSFSSIVEHPKFQEFLQQVGLPPVPRQELVGHWLNVHYENACSESDCKIRDALFFQVASCGWKALTNMTTLATEDGMVNLTVNLPNGTSLFRRAVFTSGRVRSSDAEEILWDTICVICGGNMQRCVGIVSDKFKSNVLRDLEHQKKWMVNLSCLLQGFNSLIKDFAHELPLFRTVVSNCSKVAHFFNTKSLLRGASHKYQLPPELDHPGFLRVVPVESSPSNSWFARFGPVFLMLDDIIAATQVLRSVVTHESYRQVLEDDSIAREVRSMILDVGFWEELSAVHSLVKLIMEMGEEMEKERPLVGKCLPLWGELKSKVEKWCTEFNIDEGPVEAVIEKRFKKNYHPAWSAAYVLDPLYLVNDTSGKYLPPFKHLSPDQQKDVDELVMRLVPQDNAHIALMELMKWRSEGLDPLYAKAVQMKQHDPVTGKMRFVNPQSSCLMWETNLRDFKTLGKVAARLIFQHATSCGFQCDPSLLRLVSTRTRRNSEIAMDRAQKLLVTAAHAKLDRSISHSLEGKDSKFLANGNDHLVKEVF